MIGGKLVDESCASTGSEYYTFEFEAHGGVKVVVRVADHQECYPPKGLRQISVAPGELTFAQALEILKNPMEIVKEPLRPFLSKEEKKWISINNKRKESVRLSWQNLKPLAAELTFEFNKLGGNRPAARILAAKNNVSVGKLWSALTHGARF